MKFINKIRIQVDAYKVQTRYFFASGIGFLRFSHYDTMILQ